MGMFFAVLSRPVHPQSGSRWHDVVKCAEGFFVVEAFIRNNDLVVAAQRAFHTQFQIPSCASVPDRKSILSWVANFKGTGFVVKKRGCRPRRAFTYLNTLMQFNIQFCSLHYARPANMQLLSNYWTIAVFLEFYDFTYTTFHPYKMVVWLKNF